jgi:lysophospholipase L1-like esterase
MPTEGEIPPGDKIRSTGETIKLVCFGDSNTWGFDPASATRLSSDRRWPSVLANLLPNTFEVIEEGLNGRSVLSFWPAGNPLNGAEYLRIFLITHAPVDFLILFLGINDLFQQTVFSVENIAEKLEKTVSRFDGSMFSGRYEKKVLVLSPLPVNYPPEDAGEGYARLIRESMKFPPVYEKLALRTGSLFLDTSRVISASSIDGVHIDADRHIELGEYLYEFLASALGQV